MFKDNASIMFCNVPLKDSFTPELKFPDHMSSKMFISFFLQSKINKGFKSSLIQKVHITVSVQLQKAQHEPSQGVRVLSSETIGHFLKKN